MGDSRSDNVQPGRRLGSWRWVLETGNRPFWFGGWFPAGVEHSWKLLADGFLINDNICAPKRQPGRHLLVETMKTSHQLGDHVAAPPPGYLQAKFSSGGAWRPRARHISPPRAWLLRKELLGLFLPVQEEIPELLNPDGPRGSLARSQ